MSRRRQAKKREPQPDWKYGDALVGRMISTVLRRGKKSLASRIVYSAIDLANKEKNETADPLEIVRKAVNTIRPRVEVKARRVGGATYQVPMEVSVERGTSLAVRWLVEIAASKKGVPAYKALAQEIKDAANNQGNAIKKRDEIHRMAQANKAFAHFRW
jgi:small subunit ribosomal protein S7